MSLLVLLLSLAGVAPKNAGHDAEKSMSSNMVRAVCCVVGAIDGLLPFFLRFVFDSLKVVREFVCWKGGAPPLVFVLACRLGNRYQRCCCC